MENDSEDYAVIEIDEISLEEAIDVIKCGLQNTTVPPIVRDYIQAWLEHWSELEEEYFPEDDDIYWGR